eukprot:scaffold96187_cov20-Tisochrysis_lutea.AAC.4
MMPRMMLHACTVLHSMHAQSYPAHVCIEPRVRAREGVSCAAVARAKLSSYACMPGGRLSLSSKVCMPDGSHSRAVLHAHVCLATGYWRWSGGAEGAELTSLRVPPVVLFVCACACGH